MIHKTQYFHINLLFYDELIEVLGANLHTTRHPKVIQR
jgi:hypothetical protein